MGGGRCGRRSPPFIYGQGMSKRAQKNLHPGNSHFLPHPDRHEQKKHALPTMKVEFLYTLTSVRPFLWHPLSPDDLRPSFIRVLHVCLEVCPSRRTASEEWFCIGRRANARAELMSSCECFLSRKYTCVQTSNTLTWASYSQ